MCGMLEEQVKARSVGFFFKVDFSSLRIKAPGHPEVAALKLHDDGPSRSPLHVHPRK
jgi:hypothetical protein